MWNSGNGVMWLDLIYIQMWYIYVAINEECKHLRNEMRIESLSSQMLSRIIIVSELNWINSKV